MLSCLSHNTVCSSNNQDSSIHLSSTCDHVLNVVSMSRAVYVSVVTFLCLILNVSCRNCDTTFSFFRSFIDVIECNLCVTGYSVGKNFCDSCCKSCFTMVNVADGTNITMWFCSFKFSFCHFECPPYSTALSGIFHDFSVYSAISDYISYPLDFQAFFALFQRKCAGIIHFFLTELFPEQISEPVCNSRRT